MLNASELFANIRKDTIQFNHDIYDKYSDTLSPSPLGLPLLHYAAYENSPNAIKQLLNLNASISLKVPFQASTQTAFNKITFNSNATPLMIAILRNSEKAIQLLQSQFGICDSKGLTSTLIALINQKSNISQQIFTSKKFLALDVPLVKSGQFSHFNAILSLGLVKNFEWLVDNFSAFTSELQKGFYVQIALTGRLHPVEMVENSDAFKNKKVKIYVLENTFSLLKKSLKYLETNYVEEVSKKWDQKRYSTNFGELSFIDRVPKFDPEEEKRKQLYAAKEVLKQKLFTARNKSIMMQKQKQELLEIYFSQNITKEFLQTNRKLFRLQSYENLFVSHYIILKDDAELLKLTINYEYFFTLKNQFEVVQPKANLLEFALCLNKVNTTKCILDFADELKLFLCHDGTSIFSFAKTLNNEAAEEILSCGAIICQELVKSTYENNLLFDSFVEENATIYEALEVMFYNFKYQLEILRVCDLTINRVINESYVSNNILTRFLRFLADYILLNLLDQNTIWSNLYNKICSVLQVDKQLFKQDQTRTYVANLAYLEINNQIRQSYLLQQISVEKELQSNIIERKIKFKYDCSQLYQIDLIFNNQDTEKKHTLVLQCINFLPYAKDSQFIEFVDAMNVVSNIDFAKIPQRADSRESNYSQGIYNGFYPIHYAIIGQNIGFIKRHFKNCFYQENQSSVILPFKSVDSDMMIYVYKNSCLIVIMLLSLDSKFVLSLLQPIVEDILSKSYLDLNSKLKQFLFTLLNSQEQSFSVVDILIIMKHDKYLQQMFQLLLKLYVKFFDKFNIRFDKVITYCYFSQNFLYLQKIINILPIIAKEPFILHKQSVLFFQQLNQVQQDNIVSIPTIKFIDKIIQFFTVAIIVNKYKDIHYDYFNIKQDCQDIIDLHHKPVYVKLYKEDLFATRSQITNLETQYLNSVIQSLKYSEFVDQIYNESVTNLAYFQQYKDDIDLRVSNYKTIINGFTPLQYAVYFKKMLYIQYCVDNHLIIEPSNRQIALNFNNQYIIFNNYCCHPLGISICAGNKDCFNILLDYYLKYEEQSVKILKSQQYFLRLAIISGYQDLSKSQFFLSEIKETLSLINKSPNKLTFIHDMFQSNNQELIKYISQNINSSSSILPHVQKGLIHRVNGLCPLDYIENLNFKKCFKYFLLGNICLENLKNSSDESDISLLNTYYFCDEDLKSNHQNIQVSEVFRIQQQFALTQTIYKVGNKFEQWVNLFYVQDSEKQLNLYRSDQLVVEQRETNYLFGYYEGFNQLFYAALYNSQIVLQYFLKSQSQTVMQQPVIILIEDKLVILPEGSNVIHIAILSKNQQTVNILQEYYLEQWFKVTIIESEKQAVIKDEKYINYMPSFQLTLIELATQYDIELSLIIVYCELVRLIRQQDEQRIFKILQICLLQSNSQLISKILLVLNYYSLDIILKVFAQRIKLSEHDMWYYQIDNIIKLQYGPNQQPEWRINFMNKICQYNQSRLNYYLVIQNDLFESTEIQKYYNYNMPQLKQYYNMQFLVHKNTLNVKEIMGSRQIIYSLELSLSEKSILMQNNTTISFSTQVEVQTAWFNALSQNIKQKQIRFFLKQFDTRQTNISNKIFYGFYSIHYAIIFQNLENLIKLIPFEVALCTETEQIVLFNNHYFYIPKNTNAIQLIIILKLEKFLNVLSVQTLNSLVQDGEDLNLLNKICIIQNVNYGLFLNNLDDLIYFDLLQSCVEKKNQKFFEIVCYKIRYDSLKKIAKEGAFNEEYKQSIERILLE
ncbi:hypothetical protein SS50377_20019 [Spironucleus salmonicida]|uniref:Ankyrin repeat-containing protein n=1 Tax=Spironucleus salmonicida TaxID=348837 RepID=V6LXQ2_9EUKA|nr:hypothetical protein SS50377_20019 [Spironucleus salmonicida]|eukprot:EST49412.1 Hypothetical protein SS50377_10337 [Spironucleus salmonicida]